MKRIAIALKHIRIYWKNGSDIAKIVMWVMSLLVAFVMVVALGMATLATDVNFLLHRMLKDWQPLVIIWASISVFPFSVVVLFDGAMRYHYEQWRRRRAL